MGRGAGQSEWMPAPNPPRASPAWSAQLGSPWHSGWAVTTFLSGAWLVSSYFWCLFRSLYSSCLTFPTFFFWGHPDFLPAQSPPALPFLGEPRGKPLTQRVNELLASRRSASKDTPRPAPRHWAPGTRSGHPSSHSPQVFLSTVGGNDFLETCRPRGAGKWRAQGRCQSGVSFPVPCSRTGTF